MDNEVNETGVGFACSFEATRVIEAGELTAMVEDIRQRRLSTSDVDKKYSRYHQIVSSFDNIA
jgi:hypothetical protein